MGLIYYLYENIQAVQQFGVTHFCLKLSDKVSQAEIVRELEKRKSEQEQNEGSMLSSESTV